MDPLSGFMLDVCLDDDCLVARCLRGGVIAYSA